MTRCLTSLLGLIVVVLSAGCVNVETSSGGAEEREQYAERTAADLRRDWAARLQQASDHEAAQLLLRHVLHVAERYRGFSMQVANRWDEANNGRGTPMPAQEMQQFILAWIDNERPVLDAYDEMAEFAFSRISRSLELTEDTRSSFGQLRGEYDRLFNVYSLPNTTVVDYRAAIDEYDSDLRHLIQEIGDNLDRY